MIRPRACGALIRDGDLLMVQHRDPLRSYWTLPGGGLELGETPAEAAVREVYEETGITVRAVRLLWEGTYRRAGATSPEYCFLVKFEAEGQGQNGLSLGYDPEEAHLPADRRLLQSAAWVPLTEMKGDAQVARVLLSLTEAEAGH